MMRICRRTVLLTVVLPLLADGTVSLRRCIGDWLNRADCWTTM
jgi:hypothetical protein